MNRFASSIFVIMFVLIPVLPAYAGWASMSPFYGRQCPDNPNLSHDIENQMKLVVEYAGAKIDADAVGKMSEKLLESSEKDIKRLRELYYAACEAFRTSGTLSKEQFGAFAEAWMRTLTKLTGDNGPVVLLLDSTRNAYRPALREAGANNADDIVAGLKARTSFMESNFPILNSENISSLWNRNDQIVRQRPDVVVIHFSAFESETSRFGKCIAIAKADTLCNEKFFELARDILRAQSAPYLIVYTRTPGICSKNAQGSGFRKAFRELLGLGDEEMGYLDRVILLDMHGRDFTTKSAIGELGVLIENAVADNTAMAVTAPIPGMKGSDNRCLLTKN